MVSSRAALTLLKTLILLTSFGFVSPARAEIELPPWRWSKGALGFSASGEYFRTTANYDETRGSFQRLVGDNSFTNFRTNVRARYAFARWVSVYGGLGFSYSRAVDQINEKTNSGGDYGTVGADFQIRTKWIDVVPEIELGLPFQSVDRNAVNPLLNDGALYGRGSLFLRKRFKLVHVYAHGGFLVPGDGLAKRALYGAGVEVPFGNAFAVGGGVEGYETAMNDEKTLADRQRIATNADAGSFRFYAYNPALLDAKAWVRFNPDPNFMIRAGYSKSINGIRTAEGQAFLFSLAFTIPGSRGSARSESVREQKEKNLKTFEEEQVQSADPDSFEAEDNVEQQDQGTNALDEAEKSVEKKK